VHTDDLIGLTEAHRYGIAKLVRDAEEGRRRIVVRNNRPVAAIVGLQWLTDAEQLTDSVAAGARRALLQAHAGEQG
jgi:antitoxin (DNA-binding transcriptional repressor) of toxin-antitoxin stability system